MMSNDQLIPRRFPVRQVGRRNWEVLLVPENMWLACESREDALIVAAVPVLQHETLTTDRRGLDFAEQLLHTAEVLEKYNIFGGARFFRRRAQEARS